VHPVFHVYSAEDVRVVECYLAHLARLAPRHGFGFVGGKRGKSMQVMAGDRAAAYLSSYFVRGKGSKATLQENARNPHLPRMLIWASPTLTRSTGVTMRNLRRCRQLWAVSDGADPAAVVVGRRARSRRGARRPVAGSRPVTGRGVAPPKRGRAPTRHATEPGRIA
jgi:hypothetical protein